MLKAFGFAVALSVVGIGAVTPVTLAETVMERVSRTGVLRAGTNRTAKPFAFVDDRGQAFGYSVDMLRRIHRELSAELGREIKLEITTVESDERIPFITRGKVDIICDASSFTWKRDRQVDFSLSYGVTGTRLLVRQDSGISGEPDSLLGKRVAAMPGTTNEAAVRRVQPQATVVLFDKRAETYLALQNGKVDAVAADGIFLEAWLDKNVFASQFEIAGYPYSREGVACMVPENNSALLNSVNYSIANFMQGVVSGEAEDLAIFDRWFGDESVVPLSQDLRNLALENMRLVLDFHEAIPSRPPAASVTPPAPVNNPGAKPKPSTGWPSLLN